MAAKWEDLQLNVGAPNQADSLGARQSEAGGADLLGEASMGRSQSPADTPPAGQRPSKSTNPGKGKGTGTSQTLTLTALYNVQEALREGRDLTAKEKAINDQGLISVLKDLYDELDATVLAAYGWSDLAATRPRRGGRWAQSNRNYDRVATGKRRGHEPLAGPGRHPRSAHLHLAMQTELA